MTSIRQEDTEPVKTQTKAVVTPQALPLSLLHNVDPGPALMHPHGYHSLGHCLRANIFPGTSSTWSSLSRDSYVSHPLTSWPADPHLWYGHKTDDMVQWTEKNIVNQKLKKILTEMEKKGTAK